MQPSIDPKREAMLASVAAQVAAYQRNGGTIEVLPPQEFTYRLCTVRSSAGDGDGLLLYANKRHADGSRHNVRIKGRKDGAI